MKKLILALAILIVSLSGCMEKEKLPSSADIKTSMSHSAENLSAYSFKISDSQTESIKDLVKNNITKEYNTTIRSVQTEIAGSIDLASRKAMADISATTTIKGPTGSPNILKSNGTEYNIGNTTYTSRDHGNWTQLKDPMSVDALWAQGRFNLIKSRADAIKNQSDVEVIGSESIDGKDCYKLRIIADNQTYFGTLYNMLASVLFPFVPEINQTDLTKASKIETLMWVEKDSKLLKKYQHTLSITIAPNIMGAFNLSSGGIQKFNQSMKLVEVLLYAESTESYYDYNKPHDIVVPKAALSTTPIVPSPLQAGTISG
jgi:hypothetical protein